jgi:acyl-CoA dehydrogenase
MSLEDRLVASAAERIFADFADPQVLIQSAGEEWRSTLWRALEENGLPLSWVPEAHGGSGVSLSEGFEIVLASGRAALSVPLVETMLAGWLLTQANLSSPQGPMSIGPSQPTDRVTLKADGTLVGACRGVPFGAKVQYYVVLVSTNAGAGVALVAAAECITVPNPNLAGEAAADVMFDGVRPLKCAAIATDIDQLQLLSMASVARSLQIGGALQAALSRTVDYAGQRIAFGRPIAQFQSVQNDLARFAGEAAAAAAAAASAADSLAACHPWNDGIFLEVAAARIRCADAAAIGVSIAHQVHGAIGLTLEYALHRYTLRLLSWREDFGDESYWAVELGLRIAALGADHVWPLIASR